MDLSMKILKTIDEMRERGEKLNVRAVASRCGVAPLLFYTRYPDLQMHIMCLRRAGTRRQAAG